MGYMKIILQSEIFNLWNWAYKSSKYKEKNEIKNYLNITSIK